MTFICYKKIGDNDGVASEMMVMVMAMLVMIMMMIKMNYFRFLIVGTLFRFYLVFFV